MEAVTLAEVDLEALRGRIAETVEKAKANDPAELKHRIRELETQLIREKARPPELVEKTIPVPVVNQEDLERIGGLIEDARLLVSALLDASKELHREHGRRSELPPVVTKKAEAAPEPKQERPVIQSKPITGMSAPQKRILDAIATMKSLGHPQPLRTHVAFIMGISADTGSFRSNLSSLSSGGYVLYPTSGRVDLTDIGSQVANIPSRIPTLAELHRTWIGKLSGPQGKMLEVVINHRQQPISRADMAEQLGVSHETGSFRNNLSRLSSLGLVSYPNSGSVVATDLLFPEGLL